MTLRFQAIVNGEPRMWPIEGDRMGIGRSSRNGVQIADATVSKDHAEVLRQADGYWITDLGSRNGTRVNGSEASQPMHLKESDLVEVGSVLLRIGSCFPEPTDQRMLSLWLSYPDVARLVIAAATANDVGCETIWGTSNNARSFWRHDDRARIGWQPQDSADPYAGQLAGKVSGNPIAEQHQGGIYCDRG